MIMMVFTYRNDGENDDEMRVTIVQPRRLLLSVVDVLLQGNKNYLTRYI